MKCVFLIALILAASLVVDVSACSCTADYRPVCGTNGRTYSNKCVLTCSHGKFAHSGPCRKK